MSKLQITVLVSVVIAILVGSGAALKSCTRIDAGHVGVAIKKCSGGGVDKTPIPTGYYWKSLFCEDVIEYPTSLQTIILADNDSDKDNNSITVNSIEGLPIAVDVSLSFTLQPNMVPAIYQKYRASINQITGVFIRQTMREGMQIEFAKYTAEQIYAEKKEIVRGEAQKFLTHRLGPEGFIVSQFTLNDVRVPQQVKDAINAKVAMTQDAQKAEAAVRKTRAEAEQRKAAAEGEAAALRTKADAEAYYNQTVAKSLSKEFVDFQAQQRWDGKLPQVTSGNSTPFISIPVGTK